MKVSPGISPGLGKYSRWLLAAGLMLTTVSLVYLVRYAADNYAELRSAGIPLERIPWAPAFVLYAGGILFAALGWLGAVRACRDAAPAPEMIGIALLSQIGKYVPGNIAQHLGRGMLAGSRGMSLQVVTRSMVFELGSATMAGALVALVIGSVSAPFSRLTAPAANFRVSHWYLGAAAAAVVGGVLLALTPRIALLRRILTFEPRAAIATLGLHVASVILLGLSFYAVAAAFAAELDPTFCVALFSAAWLLGFVTPGAPAGLGVRETVLVAGLSGLMGPLALPATILHRLLSVLGDAAIAVFGALVLAASARPLRPQAGSRPES